MAYTLPPLPYPADALEAAIDRTTMEIHHGKHHKAYVDNLNAALAGHANLEAKSIEQLLDGLGLQGGVAGQGGVEVVHVGLVVLAVVNLHRHLVDGLLQRVGRVRQGGKGVRHGSSEVNGDGAKGSWADRSFRGSAGRRGEL